MQRKTTEEIIVELLAQMDIAHEGVSRVPSSDSVHTRFLIKTVDERALVGEHGEHLEAFNYVVRRLVAKASGDTVPEKFFIDVNGQHEKTLEALKTKVMLLSERARSLQIDVELDPMSSYQRMLVHSLLEGTPNVKTESLGEGRSRRVVIKYIA